MGQYFKPISLDSKEFLAAHEYDNGSKLTEHSWVDNNFVGAVMELLLPGNPWWMNRIVWAGDYMNNDLFLEGMTILRSDDQEINLYSYAAEFFKKIHPPAKYDSMIHYILNYDKCEFVSLKELPKSHGDYIIHPLPILTCSGNGRGGGDFYDEEMNRLFTKQREAYSQAYKEKAVEDQEKWRKKADDLQEQIEKANPYIGRWAGDRIGVEFMESNIPKRFTEIKPNFVEV